MAFFRQSLLILWGSSTNRTNAHLDSRKHENRTTSMENHHEANVQQKRTVTINEFNFLICLCSLYTKNSLLKNAGQFHIWGVRTVTTGKHSFIVSKRYKNKETGKPMRLLHSLFSSGGRIDPLRDRSNAQTGANDFW